MGAVAGIEAGIGATAFGLTGGSALSGALALGGLVGGFEAAIIALPLAADLGAKYLDKSRATSDLKSENLTQRLST
jgi:hypothetical protein